MKKLILMFALECYKKSMDNQSQLIFSWFSFNKSMAAGFKNKLFQSNLSQEIQSQSSHSHTKDDMTLMMSFGKNIIFFL